MSLTCLDILNLFAEPAYPVRHGTDLKATESMISDAVANQTSGIGFTEVMSGFIHIGDDTEDFDLATKIAQSNCEAARFFLSVKSWNTEDCESTHALGCQ